MMSATLPPDSAARLFDVQADSRLLVALFDADDRLSYANQAYLAAYQLAPDACPCWADLMRSGHRLAQGELIEADDINAWLAAASARRRKLPFRAFEVEWCDGRSVWMTETLHPNGDLLIVASDITALHAQGLDAGRKAAGNAQEPDARTGLSQRRGTMQRLQRSLAQAEAWPLCAALLALDRLPAAAAAAGISPWMGDLARQLQASIRREDGCGHLAETELLLILPNAGAGQARAIIERLQMRVRQARPLAGQPELGYSCSAGIAQARWGEPTDALLQRLGAALARARAAGGDTLDVDEG